jgi:hypothetical protein
MQFLCKRIDTTFDSGCKIRVEILSISYEKQQKNYVKRQKLIFINTVYASLLTRQL